MSDESSASIPPELQVLLDLELTIEGSHSPAEHQKLQATLVAVPGVDSVSFSENIIAIRYDPERITKAGLSQLITAASFSISGTASATPTPVVEPGSEAPENRPDNEDSGPA